MHNDLLVYSAVLDLVTLTNKLTKVTNWHGLGLQLEVPPERLKIIEQEHPGTDRRKSEVLLWWLNNCPSENKTWQYVAAAVERLGHRNLAGELETLRPPGEHVCHITQVPQCYLFNF